MAKVPLGHIALARSGDKGGDTNIGVIARSTEIYHFLHEKLTAEFVGAVFNDICRGNVTRYELPNLNSFNFILEDSLRGGGAETMITDAQGKVHGAALLHQEVEVPPDLIP